MAIILISRGIYSGGKQLAERIAEKLGYRCLSREDILTSIAAEFRVDKETASAALKNKPGVLEGKSLSRIHYIAYLRAIICKECKDDNLVYHGYVGHSFLGGISNILRVRIVADMEIRIKVALARNNFNREEAIGYIKTVDHERVQWMKSMYQLDWLDPSLYDLVVNLKYMSIDSACVLLTYAAETIFTRTDESQKIIDDLALSSYVRAKIAALDRIDLHGGIKDYDIGVAAANGIVTISGKANSIEEAKRMIQVASEIPGVMEIKSDMHIRTSGRYDFP